MSTIYVEAKGFICPYCGRIFLAYTEDHRTDEYKNKLIKHIAEYKCDKREADPNE